MPENKVISFNFCNFCPEIYTRLPLGTDGRQGKDRKQLALFPTCLDDSLDADNETRLIDMFVNSLVLNSLGFDMDYIDNGRPAYHPGDLLKLFIYGYLNRIRSSRALAWIIYKLSLYDIILRYI